MAEEKSKKNKQNIVFLNEYFNLILLAAFIILFVLASFVLIAPKYRTTIQLIKDNISTQEQLYTMQAKKLANLKAVVKIYDDLNPGDLNKFDSVLPDDYIIETLFGELEEIILSQGYTLNSVSLSETSYEPLVNANSLLPETNSNVLDSEISAVQVSLDIGGVDYQNFKQVLKIFETSARLFDVKSLEFSSGGSSLNLVLVTYYKS